MNADNTMKILLILLTVCSAGDADKVFVTAAGTWGGGAPDGSHITVECIGGGGGGTGGNGNNTGSGGGGGGYAKKTVAYASGASVTVTVGAGGSGGAGATGGGSQGGDGVDTSWNSGVVIGKHGLGGN